MILLTGGAGYIGSHMLLELLNNNHNVLVLDNLSNSSAESIKRVETLASKTCEFVQGDIRDRQCLDEIFQKHDIQAVMHFAGLKAVGESSEKPLMYFENNISGSITLFEAMQAANVKTLVFSSSATVYGDPQTLPITENCPTAMPTNPYGYTKLAIEQMLMQISKADESWSIAALRYFNPVGAHDSGKIGEDPQGIPNNLLPFIAQVAVGRRDELSVFGDDYETPDGTGVRDYIHVVDLVQGHLKALNYLSTSRGYHVWNLGTGNGLSVLEMVRAFEQASGKQIPYVIKPRRLGDIAACYADPSKAAKELDWRATKDITDMMQDTWRWQHGNPTGY